MTERVLTEAELERDTRYYSSDDSDHRADVLDEIFIVDSDVHIVDDPAVIKEYVDEPWRRMVEKVEHKTYGDDIPGYAPKMQLGAAVRHPEDPSQNVSERIRFDDGETTEQILRDQHVDRGVLFPTNFLMLSLLPNVEYASALASAYNDYQLDKFIDQSDALIGGLMIAPQDVRSAVEEIHRVGDEKGMGCIYIPGAGLDRPLGHPQYEPIWEAASKYNLSIGFHAAASITYPEFPYNTHKLPHILRHTFGHELACMMNACDLVARGVPIQYPEVEFAFLEGGLSWMAFAMHRFDREQWQHAEQAPAVQGRPSEHLKNFYVGSQPIETPENRKDLERLLKLIDGEDRVIFATDLPHHDWDHPGSILDLPVDREIKEKILGQNAAEWLGGNV